MRLPDKWVWPEHLGKCDEYSRLPESSWYVNTTPVRGIPRIEFANAYESPAGIPMESLIVSMTGQFYINRPVNEAWIPAWCAWIEIMGIECQRTGDWNLAKYQHTHPFPRTEVTASDRILKQLLAAKTK